MKEQHANISGYDGEGIRGDDDGRAHDPSLVDGAEFCVECEKRFVTKDKLTRHRRRVHGHRRGKMGGTRVRWWWVTYRASYAEKCSAP